MTTVNITINGQAIIAPTGSTILKAAQGAGIDIPTLCHHPALLPVGACRICLVEIKGQRNLQTSCTFPITEGLDIQTESPRVVNARKLILDLLFSERNHYCMYCEMSGDCELQNLGYRYGIDHWVYPTYTKPFPVDATRRFFLMEHNRCVLCWRCMRACSELVANHTLGLKQRGASTMISADMNSPFGESSCISCGTCLQVCPTGALFNKRTAFMGRDAQTEHIKSTCNQCSLGCAMEIVTRGGNVLRIEGDWDGVVNGGLLCQKGRFDPFYNTGRRIVTPQIRQKSVSWKEALQKIAETIGGISAKEIGVLTSSNATNEALYLLDKLFRVELHVDNIGLLNDSVPKLFEKSKGSLADIQGSDIIVVAGADPVKHQPVASFLVKRTVDRGVRLIVVDGGDNGLAPFAYLTVEMADIGKAVEIARRAEHPVVLYGTGLTGAAAAALKELQGKAAFVALEPGVNTRAASVYAPGSGFKPANVKMLYILQGEQDLDGKDVLRDIDSSAFVVVQASYASPLTDRADVVLPMAIWSERAGSLVNTEGCLMKMQQAVQPAGEAKPDWEILSCLADILGSKQGDSLEELSARATQQLM
jgi:formate dehydrogenase major subunit